MTKKVVMSWVSKLLTILLVILTWRDVTQAANLLTFFLWFNSFACLLVMSALVLADTHDPATKKLAATMEPISPWWLAFLVLIPVWFGWWVTTAIICMGMVFRVVIYGRSKEILEEATP